MNALDDPRIKPAIGELKKHILAAFPEARFSLAPGEDPVGMYLTATVDIDDLDEVLDVILQPLMHMQVEDELPVYVLPVHPLERIYADLDKREPITLEPLLRMRRFGNE